MPKRSWKGVQMSGRSPLPSAIRTPCPRSLRPGGVASRKRHSSPMYCITVARWRAASSQKREADSLGATTSVHPSTTHMPTPIVPPALWNSGSAVKTTSSGRTPHATGMSVPAARKRWWRKGAALGSPVVPLV